MDIPKAGYHYPTATAVADHGSGSSPFRRIRSAAAGSWSSSKFEKAVIGLAETGINLAAQPVQVAPLGQQGRQTVGGVAVAGVSSGPQQVQVAPLGQQVRQRDSGSARVA